MAFQQGVYFAVALLVLCASVPGCMSLACTQANLNRCYRYMQGFEGELNNAIVPTLTTEEMRQHCTMYEQFEECMKDIRPYCSTIDKRVFEGIELAYDWICDDAFETYEKHHDCFLDKDLHKEGQYCNDTLTTKLNTRLDEYESTMEKRDRICQYVEDYLDCVENAVNSFCGQEAATWQRELDTRSLRPLLDTRRLLQVFTSH